MLNEVKHLAIAREILRCAQNDIVHHLICDIAVEFRLSRPDDVGPRNDRGNLESLKPFEAKDIANLFGESYSKTLSAGFEIHSAQILCGRFSRRFAEQR